MKLRHFEALRPICPVCRRDPEELESPLMVGTVAQGDAHAIDEGVLLCSEAACQREYPIIDGIPLLFPEIRAWVSENVVHILTRRDLSGVTESILGDCCGHGSWFDSTRQHLSSYAWDHYADLDPDEPTGRVQPGSVVRVMKSGIEAAEDLTGPVLDVGCSVGRTSLELANRTGELVLGVDLNYPMLRVAHEVLRTGTVRYPRRRGGVVYDRHEFAVEFANAENVDYWACDACALPFSDGTFGSSVGMNVLDCLQSPLGFLTSLARVLVPNGQAILATPYDWSGGATAMESWLGGHSQRSPMQGASDAVLRALLGSSDHPAAVPGLELVAERDGLPWHVRMHDRSTVDYSVHLIVARATPSADGPATTA